MPYLLVSSDCHFLYYSKKTFHFLWNYYLLAKFHAWHSKNKLTILRECDVNVFIKERNLTPLFSQQWI